MKTLGERHLVTSLSHYFIMDGGDSLGSFLTDKKITFPVTQWRVGCGMWMLNIVKNKKGVET